MTRPRRQLLLSDLQSANIGKKSPYLRATLAEISDDFPHKPYLVTYLENLKANMDEGVGLLLHGAHSRGKSAAAVIVLKAALKAGYSGLFVEVDHLQRLVIEKKPFSTETSWSDRMESVDFLILDDLGNEHGGDFSKAVIEGLIRSRNNRGLTTFITLNCPLEDIARRYGQSLKCVLLEHVFPVQVAGKDWREAKAKERATRMQPKAQRAR